MLCTSGGAVYQGVVQFLDKVDDVPVAVHVGRASVTCLLGCRAGCCLHRGIFAGAVLVKVVDVPVVVHVGTLTTAGFPQFIDKGRFRRWREAVMAAWLCLKGIFGRFLRHFSGSFSESSPGSQRMFRSPRWPTVAGRRGLPCQ